jgi:pyridoxal phosphate enzyme (YggS family)
VTAGDRYRTILQQMQEACARSGRSPDSVRLIGASKRQSMATLREAYDAGLRIFGENRVQEADDKKPALPRDIEWHLIGPLQSNKARKAVELFDVVQTIDRLKIARVLDREAARAEKILDVFLEVNLGSEDSKHGFLAEELDGAFEQVALLQHLRPVGLMAIPPRSDSSEQARPWFAQLRVLGERLFAGRPPARLSMGMSDDFEVAIEEGATEVRVGTALFGERPPLV